MGLFAGKHSSQPLRVIDYLVMKLMQVHGYCRILTFGSYGKSHISDRFHRIIPEQKTQRLIRCSDQSLCYVKQSRKNGDGN
jgi:hypothetical protein